MVLGDLKLLSKDEKGHFFGQETEIMVVVKLPNGQYRIVVLQHTPRGINERPINELEDIQLESALTGSVDFEDLKNACVHTEYFQKTVALPNPNNIVCDMSVEVQSYGHLIWTIPNWTTGKMTLKEALQTLNK